MKKYIAMFLIAVMIILCLSACKDNITNTSQEDKIQIVTTIFPEYDWVKEILGDKIEQAEITMLLDNGVDLHSYQPTTEDIMKISTCDLFIYVGGESDRWVNDALKEATNKDMKVINLLDVLGDSVKIEEMVEGMQEEDHGHSHSHNEEITMDNIENRTLSDFDGKWKSLYPYLLNGDLDEYCEYKAENDEDSTTNKETYIEKYKSSWVSDVNNITINDNYIAFTYNDGNTVSAEYKYAGYNIKVDDNGKISSVRYQFETDSNDAPKYVQFNDHSYESTKAQHFHVYFGDESFDKLMDLETNPFFVKDVLSVNEIIEELMGHNHEEEKDEHVWLSLKNTEILCKAISNALQEIDPDNKETYFKNTSAYIEKLMALDSEYCKVVDNAAHKTILFGDRFPFRYFVDDYGLSYYAAFVGCSAETEASFETITFLAGKVDELSLNSILTIEKSDQKIAKTIVQNTHSKDQNIMALDSMQSITTKDVSNGATYLSIMESNLEILQEALK